MPSEPRECGFLQSLSQGTGTQGGTRVPCSTAGASDRAGIPSMASTDSWWCQHQHNTSMATAWSPRTEGCPLKNRSLKGKTRLRRTKEAHFQQKGMELTQTALPTTLEHVRHRQEQSPGPACHPQGVLSCFYSPWCFPQNHSPHATTEGHKHG